ncbi:fasciclin domain-containing protein [Larkinella arboricola]|uniref:Putative surface protein with fasciclin (FAS1) repeats n=1 Tax=Larkinella arboricola TaxID=643671 RepID=A0A327X2V1_LARAB|nr:fasciclin domain-containing protein [Larkinella arboricola]RAJ99894.1 putative surface protein with fasciclin (FAS1) repeats [Larkinella arboricola]
MKKQAVFALALAVGLLVGANETVRAQTVQDSTSRSNSTASPSATTPQSGILGSSTSVSTQSNANAYGPMGAGRESRGGMKSGGSTGRDLAISAAKSAEHTVLFRALRVSGLSEQAAGKGPYTVFAPTNEAFEKLPAGTLDGLWQPAAKSKLVKLLSYHVVKGNYASDQLQDGQKLKTVTGGTLTVSKQDDAITITDEQGNTATVNRADLEATNGVIHSIDTVLMPKSK